MQREGLNETVEIGFEFRKQRYLFNKQLSQVEKLKYPVKVGSKEVFQCPVTMLCVSLHKNALCTIICDVFFWI